MRVHEVDTLGRSQVQTHTSRLKRNKNNTAVGLFLEPDHRGCAIIALHSTIQSRKRDLVLSQAILKKSIKQAKNSQHPHGAANDRQS